MKDKEPENMKNKEKETKVLTDKEKNTTNLEEKETDEVLKIASELKEAIEKQDDKKLAALLPSSAIWISNKPSDTKGFIEKLNILAKGAGKVEWNINKVEDVEIIENEISLSCETQLIITNEDTWEEQEFEFQLHIGFCKQNQGWIIAYISIVPQKKVPVKTVDQMPSPDPMLGYFAAPEYFASPERLSAPYFSAAERAYFAPDAQEFYRMEIPKESVPEKKEEEKEDLGHVAVYMPILVPGHFIKNLFK